MNRPHHISDDKLAKKAYCELKNLNSQGFTNRATDALNVVNDLDLDITEDNKIFIDICKHVVKNNFVSIWFEIAKSRWRDIHPYESENRIFFLHMI